MGEVVLQTKSLLLQLDQILGPVLISALLFFAVLANFIIRGEYE